MIQETSDDFSRKYNDSIINREQMTSEHLCNQRQLSLE